MSEETLTPSESEHRELADELEHAPLANLRATAASKEAKALSSELAARFPRQISGIANSKQYARVYSGSLEQEATASATAINTLQGRRVALSLIGGLRLPVFNAPNCLWVLRLK